MNRLKTFYLALACMAAMSLASCLDDDDNNSNNGLSAAEISQCVAATRGSYSGQLYYRAANSDDANDIADTVSVTWTVAADTTVTISKLPPAVVTDYIKDSEMKTAMAAAQPQPLQAALGFYQADPVGFLLYPLSVQYDIEYKGGNHKATLVFWVNNYSYGVYSPSSGLFEMQFVIASLLLDDNTSFNYLTDTGSGTIALNIWLSNQKEE